MDKELIEDRLYQIINQLNERLHLHYIYKGLFNTIEQSTSNLSRKWYNM